MQEIKNDNKEIEQTETASIFQNTLSTQSASGTQNSRNFRHSKL